MQAASISPRCKTLTGEHRFAGDTLFGGTPAGCLQRPLTENHMVSSFSDSAGLSEKHK